MPAGVVEAAQFSCVIADKENALVRDLESTERTRQLHSFRAANIDPVAKPDASQFPLVLCAVEIKMRRKSLAGLSQTVVARVFLSGYVPKFHRLPPVALFSGAGDVCASALVGGAAQAAGRAPVLWIRRGSGAACGR